MTANSDQFGKYLLFYNRFMTANSDQFGPIDFILKLHIYS